MHVVYSIRLKDRYLYSTRVEIDGAGMSTSMLPEGGISNDCNESSVEWDLGFSTTGELTSDIDFHEMCCERLITGCENIKRLRFVRGGERREGGMCRNS